jgi:hypothetical protein
MNSAAFPDRGIALLRSCEERNEVVSEEREGGGVSRLRVERADGADDRPVTERLRDRELPDGRILILSSPREARGPPLLRVAESAPRYSRS